METESLEETPSERENGGQSDDIMWICKSANSSANERRTQVPSHVDSSPESRGLKPRVTGLKPRVTGLKPRVTGTQTPSHGTQAPSHGTQAPSHGTPAAPLLLLC
ncbi:hypothetical protein EYF80_033037 [Liparis tanakae]|uniref:Uncharacterized protein n=1 Tax=Liparis tanakae TaxID=230148 RepID=A0A4Z2GTN8_9TELE|nr:hypothetical protein EYF80_033037 [Liparis tanakae]